MNIRTYFFSSLIVCSAFQVDAGIIGALQKSFASPDGLFAGVITEKANQLEMLKDEIAQRSEKESAFIKKETFISEQLKLQLAHVRQLLKNDPDNKELIAQKSLIKEIDQVVKDVLRSWNDLTAMMNDYKKELEGYLHDTSFEFFAKEHKIQERVYYSFEDLQRLYESIQAQERLVAQLIDIEKNAIAERDTRNRSLSSVEKKYTQQQEELIKQKPSSDIASLDIKHAQNRAEQELQLFKIKKTLEKLRLKQAQYEIDSALLRLFIARAQLDMLKKHVRIIKRGIRVSSVDIAQDKEKLQQSKDEFFASKDILLQKRENITQQKKEVQELLDQKSAQYDISLGRSVNEWSRSFDGNVQEYQKGVEVSLLNSKVQLFERQKQLYDAEIDFAQEKFNYQSLQVWVKETYNAIANRQFYSEDEITKEKQKYQSIRSDAKVSSDLYKERITTAANLLNTQKKVVDNIALLRKEVEKEKDGLFAANNLEYKNVITKIAQAEELEKTYVDVLSKLTGIYSGISNELDNIGRLSDFIIDELQASTIWYRPAYAISWQGMSSIITDSLSFLQDVSSYVFKFNITHFFAHLFGIFKDMFVLIILLLQLALIVFACLFVRTYGIEISEFLLEKSQNVRGLLRVFSFLFGVSIRFICLHAVGIACWIALGSISFSFPDPYLHILYYLFSILYLLYLAHSYIALLMFNNSERGYVLLPIDFQSRFKLVISFFLYVTIVIFFFRQAFILSGYYIRSELPNILLAANFIVFQLSLIFLITKEQILSIIPERTKFWRNIKELVDHYYYPILLVVITVIIMSNPYVGFGRLVLYILSSVIYTILLFKGLLWGQALLKNAVSYTFFETSNGVIRERFSYAKTLFGLLVLASFLITAFLGVLIGAKIWGWPVNLSDIIFWLNKPFMLQGTANPITTYSLFQIIGFILFGFILSYMLEKFVLSKIFDLLFVESGVQHTIIRITQYIIIIMALFLGFQNVGLGALIGYMFGALALSVGWYIKDPISDFFAYFIILVQRPINIGDYIFLDDLTQGVVRKITARSVVLRRRNSTMVVVPNSHIVSRSLHNWNYIRSFVAFDDIMISVSYQEDPAKVRELLLSVLDVHPRILKNPKPIVRLNDFGDHGYRFLVRGFVSSAYTLDMWDIASEVRFTIVKTFQEYSIKIAVPVRVYSQSQFTQSSGNNNKKKQSNESDV